ncbi:hypothetical protein JCM8547_000784 [Rhodosporidiobolus lusitaniae]
MSFGPCCIQGYLHEGEPKGFFEEVNGVRSYVALTSSETDKTKALIILTDIFGIDVPNIQLLADSFALSTNLSVYLPDILNGDAIRLEDRISGKVKLEEWLKKHGKEETRPTLDRAVEGLRERGVERVGAVGYCFGGRYAVDLVLDGVVSVAAVAHPTMLETPKDIEFLNKTSAHFLWLNALQDFIFSKEKQDEAKRITVGNEKHKHVDFDAGHGFANRGDPHDPKIRAEADRAFKQAAGFVREHL